MIYLAKVWNLVFHGGGSSNRIEPHPISVETSDLSSRIFLIYKQINECQPKRGQTFDKEKMLEVLATSQRLLSLDAKVPERLGPLIVKLESALQKSSLDKVKKVFDSALIIPPLHALGQENNAITQGFKDTNLLQSMIWIEKEGQRRCTFELERGELFLKPGDMLTERKVPHVDTNGYPASANTLEQYLKMLDEQPAVVEHLDYSYLSDLFEGPELSIPSNIEINVDQKFALLRKQAAMDMPRVHAFFINGNVLFDKSRGAFLENRGPSDCVSKQIFMMCMPHFNNNEKLVNNISKLITQASRAQPWINMLCRYTKPELNIHLNNNIFMSIEISSKDRTGTKGQDIIICLKSIVGIIHIGDTAEIIRYAKAVRQFVIPRKSLEEGSVRGGMLSDSYSKFYRELKQAQEGLLGCSNVEQSYFK